MHVIMHVIVYGTFQVHLMKYESHGILRMDSFRVVMVNMVILYPHRCPLYEQQQVYHSCLLILLYKPQIDLLQLAYHENPCIRILYGITQHPQHHYGLLLLNLLEFQYLLLIQLDDHLL